MPQNLISDKYYDLWLSIDTKNSPLSGILLLLQAAELRRSKMKIFKQKKSKFQILSYRGDIYPKRKLRTSTIQIQPEKVWIFAKKMLFFQFFWFSRHARGPPEIFDVHFFENFKKKFQKWLYWVLSNIERNKVMNFGEPSTNPVETADHFRSCWP